MTGHAGKTGAINRPQFRRICLRVLAGGAALLACACISAGTGAITDPAVVSQIQVEKSTREDVANLLGLPLAVSFPQDGVEEWNYPYLVEYPGPMHLLPIIRAYTELNYKTRILTVIFNRPQGIVTRVEQAATSGGAASVPKYF